MAQTRTVTKVGPFNIDAISVNGKLDRCAATLQPGPNMLRIALVRSNNVFSISVPPAPSTGGPLVMHLDLGAAGSMSFPATMNSERAWAAVNSDAITKMQAVRKNIVITLGSKRFSWPIGNASMAQVISAVESCTT